ncbi:hypothetical protein ACI6QG_14990 [Roseococcus sp. DSY-14]|uniref:hypothetical protein n=1 Tax=Roseococcus sp. DSY-14 TaxID=3369650 RepID=UPI00387B343E
MTAMNGRDDAAVATLIIGVTLAVVATLLPVLQVPGQSGVLRLTAWQVLPWFTKVKLLALGLLLAAAFLPQLAKWRLPMAAFAVIMVFVPSVSAFISAVYAWSEVRAEIVRQTGNRNPFVQPGMANFALVAAGLLVSWAVWRLEARKAPEGAAAPAAA